LHSDKSENPDNQRQNQDEKQKQNHNKKDKKDKKSKKARKQKANKGIQPGNPNAARKPKQGGKKRSRSNTKPRSENP